MVYVPYIVCAIYNIVCAIYTTITCEVANYVTNLKKWYKRKS